MNMEFVKQGNRMAHEVTFTVSQSPLERKDIKFLIRKNGAMLGTLKVSRGDPVWRPRNDTCCIEFDRASGRQEQATYHSMQSALLSPLLKLK